MKPITKPMTKPGKLAFILICSAILFLAVFQVTAVIQAFFSTETEYEKFFDNLYLAVPLLCAWVTSTFAFLLGIISIVFKKEKSILVILSTIVGLFVFAFGLGEIFFSH